jgi:hypothetical protein
MLSVDSVWKNSLFNYPGADRTKMKIGGYGSIATSSAVAAVRKPNRPRSTHDISVYGASTGQRAARPDADHLSKDIP